MKIQKLSSRLLIICGLLASPILYAQETPWKQIQLHGNGYSVAVSYQLDPVSLSEAGTDVLATPIWVNINVPGANPNRTFIAILSSVDDSSEGRIALTTTPVEINFNDASSRTQTGYSGQLDTALPNHLSFVVGQLAIEDNNTSHRNLSPTHQILTITELTLPTNPNGTLTKHAQTFQFKLFN